MTQRGLEGPVSIALEAELRERTRQQGVVVWLDKDGLYGDFVARLQALRAAGGLPYDVHAFRGSHLALMLALDGVAAGTGRVPLVIHLPGFNEDTVRETPLFEVYAAGVRYRKALDTLVSEAAAGRVKPEQSAAFNAQPGVTLAGADAWLGALLQDAGGGFAAQLQAMAPAAVLDDLLAGGYVAGCVSEPAAQVALWDRLGAWLGLPDAWREAALPGTAPRAEDFAFAAASWALCVEFVKDLQRDPVNPHLLASKALPKPVIEACQQVAAHLRERHPAFYQRTADETEALIADEVEAARAEDLGRIDTFRFEEAKVLKAALAALGQGQHDVVAEWAGRRVGAKVKAPSFWLREDPARHSAWQLVDDAARLGQAIARAGASLGGPKRAVESLEAAVQRYVDHGAVVDQAHRHLEQRRVTLLYPQLPEFETLRARLDAMRAAWRAWADAWALAFNEACQAHGFLGPATLQQRTLFDEEVRPLTQDAGITALFVIDAFRFEMGLELCRQLEGQAATTLHLRPRLAELPTVTEVGMNVLAPVAKGGRLHVALDEAAGKVQGIQTGEFRVFDPDTRRRAMHDRVGGATCPWLTLKEVAESGSDQLKRKVAQAKLVVVHSQEIDQAGEQGVGPAVFDVVMQRIRAAWRLLRDANVRRFVFTADHGFLLLDDAAATAQAHGRRVDPHRRHVFSPVAADHTGEVRVPLAELGYEGATGHLMFPRTTAVFDTGRRGAGFVHGGNSLQERVIPVLTVLHREAGGSTAVEFTVAAEAAEGLAGMHCVKASVEMRQQLALAYGAPQEVELALRVPEDEGIQVELCQARGKARMVGGIVVAPVGEPFEVFFRLSGPSDTRVLVELYHPSGVVKVEPGVPSGRFAVSPTRAPSLAPAPEQATPAPGTGEGWLAGLASEGVRQVFGHLAAHGAITEPEAAAMLGGAREFRRFALNFENHAKLAPFSVRIDVVGGVKRYVREGAG
jgi:hypothetical protein